MKEKNPESLFAIKEFQKRINIAEYHLKCLATIYYLTYITSREFGGSGYSPEEMCFLYLTKRALLSIREFIIYKGMPPKEVNLSSILNCMPSYIIYIVEYLKELGFNSKPNGITFGGAIEKNTKSEHGYKLIIENKYKDQSVHEYLHNKIKEKRAKLAEREAEERQVPGGYEVGNSTRKYV